MSDQERIAVVGGGIGGLFCAYVLAKQGKSVDLFESSDRWGGRIRTIRLGKNNEDLGAAWTPETIEFYAEFGPMRVELDKQRLLKALLDAVTIFPKRLAPAGEEGKAYLTEFPSYGSPTSPHEPHYDLLPAEVGKSPLDLLQMALLRVMTQIDFDDGTSISSATKALVSSFRNKQRKLIDSITTATAVQLPVEPIFAAWMRTDLGADDYWVIQTQGRVQGVPLYAMGFWNLLSDYLSHNAIMKMRDLGTFYHLLPENPNAAEWLTWWLIGFAIGQRLQGVFGGMECIVDRLVAKIVDLQKAQSAGGNVQIRLKLDSSLRAIEPTTTGWKLRFQWGDGEYHRVVLALPKAAVVDVVRNSPDAFEKEKDIHELLDCAFGFPMVKTFVVVRERWWDEERANSYANRVPTRELHYWKGVDQKTRQGLIMAYTDRPASSFWANYIPPGSQADVWREGQTAPSDMEKSLFRRLRKKVVQYINENEVPDITPEDILWCGVRDWARAPYGGANHAWRPERKYWVVMRRLGSISNSSGSGTIHLCGEAYSDYHGFIEGALRSAVYALHSILDGGTHYPLYWLGAKSNGGPVIPVDEAFRKELADWVQRLDEITPDTPFLYQGE